MITYNRKPVLRGYHIFFDLAADLAVDLAVDPARQDFAQFAAAVLEYSTL
jgi:hypothetical protein